MNEEPNQVISQMQIGARIQKFYDYLSEYRKELKEENEKPFDELADLLLKSKIDFLHEILDDYSSIFDDIIQYG